MWGQNWTPPTAGNNSGAQFSNNPFGNADPNACCAPVEILDRNGNIIAVIASGGTYTVTLNSFDLTFTFPAGSTLYDATIQKFSGVLSLDALPANVTSFNLKITTAGVTTLYTQSNIPLLINVTIDDVISLEVTPTSLASGVTFTMRIDYNASSLVKSTSLNVGNGRYGGVVCAFDQTVHMFDTDTNTSIVNTALPGARVYKPAAFRPNDQRMYIFGNLFGAALDMNPANIGTTFGTILQSGALGLVNVVSAEYDPVTDKMFLGRAADMDVFTPSTFTSAAANSWLGTVTRANSRMTFIKQLRALVVGDDTGVAMINVDEQFVMTQYGFSVGQLRMFGGKIYGTGVNQALRRRVAPSLLKSITSVISTGSNLGGVAFVPSLNRAYFCNRGVKSIGVMNMTTGAMLGNITWAGLADGCRDIKYCPYNGMLYAQASSASGAAGCDRIYVIDPNSGAIGAYATFVQVGNMESSGHNLANSMIFNSLTQ